MPTTNPLDLAKTLVGQYSFVYDSDRIATLQNLGLTREALDGTVVALVDGATPAANWSLSNIFTWTSAGTSTLSFTNTTVKSVLLVITGGSASAITWPTVTWTSGFAPASPANGAKLVVRFTKVGTTIYAEDCSAYATALAVTDASNLTTQGGFITTLQSQVTAINLAATQASAVITDAASVTVNWNTANVFRWTTAQATTVTFSNTAEGVRVLVLTGSGGSSVITWPTITWNGGAAPSNIANTKTQIIKIRKAGTVFYGNVEVAN